MAYDKQLFIGKLSSFTPKYDNVIAFNGTTVSGAPQITGVVALGGFDLALLRVGQIINTISGGGFSGDVTITSISGTTISVNTNAAASQTGGTFTSDTPAGIYFFSSASFSDPQNILTVNNITGSADTDFDISLSSSFAVLGSAAASLGGSAILGKFHYYKITEVVSRDLGASSLSAFVAWGEVGSESDSGDVLFIGGNQAVAIGALSVTASQMNIFGDEILTGLSSGADVAGYQIALPQIIDHTGSDGGGASEFPFSGSAQFTGSIGLTGSQEIRLNATENFLIKNQTQPTQSLFNIDREGVATFRARTPEDGIPTAVVGGLYFGTSSAYIGTDEPV